MPSAADTTNSAASAARSPARTSPTKSPYPGVSSRLTLTSPCSSEASAEGRPSAAAVLGLVGVADGGAVLDPAGRRGSRRRRAAGPRPASSCPTPEWPTRATLRTERGGSAAGCRVPCSTSVTAASCPPRASPVARRCVRPAMLHRTGSRDEGNVAAHRGLRRPRAAPLGSGRRRRPRRTGPSCSTHARRAPSGRVLTPLGRALARAGVSPDASPSSAPSASWPARWPSTRGALPRRALVHRRFRLHRPARRGRRPATGRLSAWGAFLDSTLDRVADAAIFGCAALLVRRGRRRRAPRRAALYCLVGRRARLLRQGPGRGPGAHRRRRDRGARRSAWSSSSPPPASPGLGVPYVLAAGALAARRRQHRDRRASGSSRSTGRPRARPARRERAGRRGDGRRLPDRVRRPSAQAAAAGCRRRRVPARRRPGARRRRARGAAAGGNLAPRASAPGRDRGLRGSPRRRCARTRATGGGLPPARLRRERVSPRSPSRARSRLRAALAAGRGVISRCRTCGNWDHAGAWAIATGCRSRRSPSGCGRSRCSTPSSPSGEGLGMEVLPADRRRAPAVRPARRAAARGAVGRACSPTATSPRRRPGDFFGATARMPAGPALLALRTGAAAASRSRCAFPDDGRGAPAVPPGGTGAGRTAPTRSRSRR